MSLYLISTVQELFIKCGGGTVYFINGIQQIKVTSSVGVFEFAIRISVVIIICPVLCHFFLCGIDICFFHQLHALVKILYTTKLFAPFFTYLEYMQIKVGIFFKIA